MSQLALGTLLRQLLEHQYNERVENGLLDPLSHAQTILYLPEILPFAKQDKDLVVTIYLSQFKRELERNPGIVAVNFAKDFLWAALHFYESHGASIDVGNRLAQALARMGRLEVESFCLRHLGRAPSEEEVALLVTNYVEDTAARATHIEEDLERIARAYLSPKAAEAQVERIREFGTEWDSHPFD